MEYTLKFIIRKDRENSTANSPLYLRYTFNRKFYNIPLKEGININFWDEHIGKPIPKFKDSNRILGAMNNLERNVRSTISNFFEKTHRYPQASELKVLIKSVDLVQTEDELSVEKAFEEYIKSKKAFVSLATIVVYNAVLSRLKEYFEWIKTPMTWASFDSSFSDKFREFCFYKNYSKNTIGKYNKQIKGFLKFSSQKYKTIVSEQYENLKIESEVPKIISLTSTELEQLKSVFLYTRYSHLKTDTLEVLKYTAREQLIGRIFIFLCRTGLRYSDFERLTFDNLYYEIDIDGTPKMSLQIAPQKTKSIHEVVIPLLSDVIDLLFIQSRIPYKAGPFILWDLNDLNSKTKSFYTFLTRFRNGDFPHIEGEITNWFPYYPRIFPKLTNQEFNREVKDVCKKVGIKNNISRTITIAGKPKSVSIEKHKAITSHVGRKTFVTLSLEAGISQETIRSVTGHTDHRSMKPYINISPKAVINEYTQKMQDKIPEEQKPTEKKR